MKNKKRHHLLILIIFLFSYSILRFGEFGTGQEQILPILYRMENADYLSNDEYTNSLSEFNARTYYIQFVFLINKLVNNLQLTFFILFIISFLLIFINFFYLAYLFFEDEKKSFFIACLSYIAITFSLDGTDLTKFVLTPATAGWLFGLISINFYLRKKNFLAFLMAGIASLFQVVIGSIFFAIFAGDIILRKPFISKQKIINLFKTIPFLILYSFSVIPLLIVNAKTSTPEMTRYASYIIGWFAHPGHILPSNWSFIKWFVFFLFITFFYIAIKKSTCSKEYKSKIRNFAIVVALICFIGWFFVEIIPISSIVKMQLFRATIILNVFGLIFIGDYIHNRIKNARNLLEKTFFFILPLSLLSPFLVLILIPTFFIIQLLKIFKFDVFKVLWKNKMLLFMIALAALTLILITFKNFPSQIINFWPKTTHSAIAYVIAPIVFYILTLIFLNTKRIKKVIPIILIIFTISLFIFYHPLERKYTCSDERWELIGFVRANTPSNSTFLISPRLEGFRVYEKRAIIVDEYHPYSDEGIVRWFEKIKDVSNNFIQDPKRSDYEKINEYYHTLDKGDMLRLKEKYHFDYVIFDANKKLPFKEVFKNKEYVVYKI